MHERIKELRKALELSQTEFGRRINLSQNYIWMIEKGERTPSDRTITDICHEYHCSETWLRTGEGMMFPPRNRNEQIADFMTALIRKPDDSKAKRFVLALSTLSEQELETLSEIATKIASGEI